MKGSHISFRFIVIEFTRHAFPLAIVSDLDNMISPDLVHNMNFVAAQCMFYLGDGARRVQRLSDLEKRCATLVANEPELKRQVSVLD